MDTTLQDTRKITSFITGWRPTSINVDVKVLENEQEVLDKNDFPTTKIERWKYTRTTKISNKKFNLSNELNLVNLPKLPIVDAYNIVFINGVYSKELSSKELEQGVRFLPIELADEAINFVGKAVEIFKPETVKADARIFKAINTVYANGGAFIEIAPKTIVTKPIQLVFIASGEAQAGNIRNVVIANKLSEATISQVFLSVGAKDCLTNVVTEFFVEEGAKIVGDKIQNQDETSLSVSSEFIQQARDAHFALNTITLNGVFVRNNVDVDILGENGETHLNGAYILKDKQHIDNHTFITHYASNCFSNETYKGVMDGESTAVFNGMILVKPNAQRIDSYQSNGNVLLSETATVNSKPELEIYADDVKCSHGSTTGQLDDDAIFYLRARGISERNAKALMVTAFIDEVLQKINNEEIINYLHDVLNERYGWEF